ncbi:proline dehydrogenase, partial [Tremellales sp. Uapishka_1]
MLSRHLTRAAVRPLGRSLQPIRQSSSRSRSFPTSSKSTPIILSLATLGLGYTFFPHAAAEEEIILTPAVSSLSAASTPTLIRSYLVWTLCTLPSLIDHSPALLNYFTNSSIPGLAPLTNLILRHSFFAQFVPGESVEECFVAMRELRERGVGVMLNYSAEMDENVKMDEAEVQKVRMKEIELALEKLGEYERSLLENGRMPGSSGFALKVSGIISPDLLHRASTTLLRLRPLTNSNSPSSPASRDFVPYPGTPQSSDIGILSRSDASNDGQELLALGGPEDSVGVLASDEGLRKGDLDELKEGYRRVRSLAFKARANGVKLLIDAEHSWHQPALDSITLLLSEEFNQPTEENWKGPLIFGTYQAYLTRQPQYLHAMLEHSVKHGYALGVKLVRGAYFEQERKAWKADGRPGADPIWKDKAATDNAYNSSITTLLHTLASQIDSSKPQLALSVTFGTHNDQSSDRVCEALLQNGLAKTVANGKLRLREDVEGKIMVAQLYGMKDDLTDKVAATFEINETSVPVACKYLAYGTLQEVIPFLGRRAVENKSLMSGDSGAGAERKRVGDELKKRLFSWL